MFAAIFYNGRTVYTPSYWAGAGHIPDPNLPLVALHY